MAMYRIKPEGEPLPQSEYPPEEYWREIRPGQMRDIDIDEIEQLNRLADEEEAAEDGAAIGAFRLTWLRALLALLVIAGFVGLMTADAFRYNIDYAFLSESVELKQDESLAALRGAVVVIECGGSGGTGFNISADGLIVTNKHVVDQGGIISVSFGSFDGGERQVFTSRHYVEVAGADMALIDIDGENLPTLPLNSSYPAPGDDVIFIGNPLGFDWTISQGKVAGLPEYEDMPVILFNGPVRPGSSGSPLFNAEAEVIGVIYASLKDVKDSGLAIPVSYLIKFLEENGQS